MIQDQPLDPNSRIESIDVIRGWALLGILVINIWAFAQPMDMSFNPTLFETYAGADVAAFFISWIGFEGSQRAMFSMLFGASIVLLTSRLASGDRLAEARAIYYRRTWILIGFGLVDILLFLWFGDILLLYGLLGLFLYFLRNSTPKKLLIIGTTVLLLLSALFAGISVFVDEFRETATIAQEKVLAGEKLSANEEIAVEVMDDLNLSFTAEERAELIESRSDSYTSAWLSNLPLAVEIQVQDTLYMLLWDAMGMMLLGMALFKLGVFSAECSFKTYWTMLIIGFGVGISVNTYEMLDSMAKDYHPTYLAWTYQIGRISTAFGYIGLFMLICKYNVLSTLRRALSAVGKMALTNYLTQSVLCLIIFVFFGLYGELRFHEFYYVVVVIWVFQIFFSQYWLKHFKYGPVEWLWRSLTYKRRVSNRIEASATS